MKKILMSTVLTEAFYKSRFELIEEFLKKGYDVILVGPDPDELIEKMFEGRRLKYYAVDFDRTGTNIIKDLKTIKDLAKIIKLENPSITYAFGGAKAAIYTSIASSKNKIKDNFCMINGLGSVYRGSGIKNKVIEQIMTFLFKLSLNKSKGIFFQNKDDFNVFLDKKIVKREKCKIVSGSGVNLEKFPYNKPNIENIRFLFVGRLLKDKGIYEFVEAAKIIKQEYPKIECWILGGFDSNHTSVSQEEMDYWVDNGYVEYFGRQNNVYDYYKESSVFVLPSYHEGTPRTNLEAMAVGRPIITTDAPGCRETVIDRKNGFMVPIKNVSELVDKMKIFINNPDNIIEMGLESHNLAKLRYDVNKVNESIIEFILG